MITGLLLDSLISVPGSHRLIDGLRQSRASDLAEAVAVHVVVSGSDGAEVEIDPEVRIGKRVRHPDFRARLGGEPWTYCEVTAPDMSELGTSARALAGQLAAIVKEMDGSIALEIFLREAPTPEAVEAITSAARSIEMAAQAQFELPGGIGLLRLNQSVAGWVVLETPAGEKDVPRIGVARVVRAESDVRHIAVRVPFADGRAEDFLRREARQLPNDCPGALFINVGQAAGTRGWRNVIERRLASGFHTRVGVCGLTQSSLSPSPDGERWSLKVDAIMNERAALSAPEWLIEALNRFPMG